MAHRPGSLVAITGAWLALPSSLFLHPVSIAIDGTTLTFIRETPHGDVDVVWHGQIVLLNPGGFANNWISLKLVGVKTNRAALGARIRLTLDGAGAGSRLRYREVTSGGSFGASSLAQHIGLGKASRIATLEIHWPVSRTTQR